MQCHICKISGCYAYVRVNGVTLCIPCCSMAKDAHERYVQDVIHKAKHYPPTIHEHRKIQDPDGPSGSMI